MPFAMMRRNRRVCVRKPFATRTCLVERLRSMWQAHFFGRCKKTAWQPDEQIAMPNVYVGIP